jgi:hypothetical protein
MHEGIELEQVEPRNFGQIEPRGDQRRVDHDRRRARYLRDRLAARDATGLAVGGGAPDAAMGCVQRRKIRRRDTLTHD